MLIKTIQTHQYIETQNETAYFYNIRYRHCYPVCKNQTSKHLLEEFEYIKSRHIEEQDKRIIERKKTSNDLQNTTQKSKI